MIALVDCNNFFVSCERVFRPDLEGKAVVVLSNNDGCVVSRSNESKAMGIQMCTPFFKIKYLAEQGRLTAFSSNYALYGDLSNRVMSILADAVPKIEIYSIDEAYLHLDGISHDKVPDMCRDLRAKVRQWVGIPVSIGVAPTKTLAKIASHFAKKYPGYRGVCMMDTEEKRVKALKLTVIDDVWGVGRRLAPKMHEWGIKTAYDFTQRPERWVKDKLGVNGLRTWEELRGRACIDEEKEERRKSICTSRSFADMISDKSELESRVSDFAAMCAKKLREEGSVAYDVTTFLYTNRFREDLQQYFPSMSIRLPVAANSAQEIVGTALKAFRLIYRSEYQYKKAGVVVSNIIPAESVQGTIFDFDQQARQKNDRISEVIDKLGGQSRLLRLAAQRPGHYADGIRSEHCSGLYTTSIEDIIKVR
jgi:DNA polymerase V